MLIDLDDSIPYTFPENSNKYSREVFNDHVKEIVWLFCYFSKNFFKV
jgi:hypothetical protein